MILMPDDGPFRCPLRGCGQVYDTKSALKQHLSKTHGIQHTISQLELLSAVGYENKSENRTIKIEFDLKSMGVL